MKTELETLSSIINDAQYTLSAEDIITPTVAKALERLGTNTAPNYEYTYERELNPPARSPSVLEQELAVARYALEEDVWEIIYYLEMYIQVLEGNTATHSAEDVESRAKKLLRRWNAVMDEWDDNTDIWNLLVDVPWFHRGFTSHLNSAHGGDCTAYPSTCMRCTAEQKYKIPSTVTWNRSEGYKMRVRYAESVNNKKQ